MSLPPCPPAADPGPAPDYGDLDFAKRTGWAEFLDAYLGHGRTGEAR